MRKQALLNIREIKFSAKFSELRLFYDNNLKTENEN